MESKLSVGSASDRGRERENNEDTFRVPRLYQPDLPEGYELPDQSRIEAAGLLFLVADGLGGHAAGERASAEASNAFVAAYYLAVADEGDQGRLIRAMQAADARVRECIQANPELEGMGTTLTAAAVRGNALLIGHVGDSRGYLLREGIEQLTEDHTQVMEWLKLGRITAEQARQARHSGLTQVVGMGEGLEPQVLTVALKAGDRILLCTDGLHGMIRDPAEIARITRAHPDPQAACEALVAEANARGGEDNVTVVLVEVAIPE